MNKKTKQQLEKFAGELATANESLQNAKDTGRLGDSAYWEGVTDALRWVIQEMS